ncbi:hypothetical protein PR001_g14737 [Phytophthora rubi]|uniref:Uncharacterized protein n=2 Tax=Phytophthora rubi TaxID=129364 RepID=A0A6A3LAM7_9STRA|nr:hypothetical protein PR001_g14737 [Phytophthora rubi]
MRWSAPHKLLKKRHSRLQRQLTSHKWRMCNTSNNSAGVPPEITGDPPVRWEGALRWTGIRFSGLESKVRPSSAERYYNKQVDSWWTQYPLAAVRHGEDARHVQEKHRARSSHEAVHGAKGRQEVLARPRHELPSDVIMAALSQELTESAEVSGDMQQGTLLDFHKRLARLNYDAVELLAKELSSGIYLTDHKRVNCLTCAEGKPANN